jgi:hypothetical protein
VKKLLKYTNNKLGFFVMIKDDRNIIKYVKITPQPVQRYAELEVDYKIYSEEEYKSMNLKDDWVKIRMTQGNNSEELFLDFTKIRFVGTQSAKIRVVEKKSRLS